MPPQIALSPERSVALLARMVPAVPMHRAQMRPQIDRLPERSAALRARVVSAFVDVECVQYGMTGTSICPLSNPPVMLQ